MQIAAEIRKGARVEYTYAAGKVVTGKIVKAVTDHPGWFVARLWDEHGESCVSIHASQTRVISNAA